MIRELRDELERVKKELQGSLTGRRMSTASSLLLMRGQIKETEAIIEELEMPWEEKVKQSEVRMCHVTDVESDTQT
jgi:hypothetical protein